MRRGGGGGLAAAMMDGQVIVGFGPGFEVCIHLPGAKTKWKDKRLN